MFVCLLSTRWLLMSRLPAAAVYSWLYVAAQYDPTTTTTYCLPLYKFSVLFIALSCHNFVLVHTRQQASTAAFVLFSSVFFTEPLFRCLCPPAPSTNRMHKNTEQQHARTSIYLTQPTPPAQTASSYVGADTLTSLVRAR